MYHSLLRNYQIMVIFIVSLTFNSISARHRHLKVRWGSFDCRVHADFVSEYKCQVVQPRRSALNVELNLLQELRSIKVYTLISTKPPSGVIYRKLFDNILDGCRVISQLSQKGITSKIYGSVIKSSNQPNKCPIRKGFIYYYNISVEEVMPSFVPVSHLMTQVNFYAQNQCYLNVTLKGSVMDN
ncbi:uncharacterized protein LOC135432504 [Drosophila montana]|uniref:uncharacterized protein LOC135432504 n=1 Tax=Drosophila montana TaxID=40370 RepID=UPI00313ED3FB